MTGGSDMSFRRTSTTSRPRPARPRGSCSRSPLSGGSTVLRQGRHDRRLAEGGLRPRPRPRHGPGARHQARPEDPRQTRRHGRHAPRRAPTRSGWTARRPDPHDGGDATRPSVRPARALSPADPGEGHATKPRRARRSSPGRRRAVAGRGRRRPRASSGPVPAWPRRAGTPGRSPRSAPTCPSGAASSPSSRRSIRGSATGRCARVRLALARAGPSGTRDSAATALGAGGNQASSAATGPRRPGRGRPPSRRR